MKNVTLETNSRFFLLNFVAFTPIRQMYANFPRVDHLGTALKFRKRKKTSLSLVYVLHET